MTTVGRTNKIYQTAIPFVEMYINKHDILRSRDGKPRTLVSFTHDIYMGTGGFWTLEIFDPDYIAVEDFLVSTAVDASVIAEKIIGEPEGGTDQQQTNMSSAAFRYGYAGHSHDEVVSILDDNYYFYGSVHAYVPRYETNGTYLTIRGDSAGTRIRQIPIVYNNYTGQTILQVFESVCQQQEWKLELTGDLNSTELAKALKAEAPGKLGVTDDSAVHTELESPQQNKREGEDALSFLNRLCLYVRTVSTEFNNIYCRLEYRVTDPMGALDPQGILYLGADTPKKGPVREYTYMRDPTSDVISFQPSVQVWVAGVVGASGLTFKLDSARKGDIGVYSYDERNRQKKKLLSERGLGGSSVSYSPDAAVSVQQKGIEHTPDGTPEGVSEKNVFAGEIAPDQDKELATMTVSVNDDIKGDHQTLNYWLAMQNMVSKASLQVFGDPSEDLVPGNVVKVNVYVPTEAGGMDIYWVTNYWIIVGVNHEIRGGSIITNLELVRHGVERGGVAAGGATVDSAASKSQEVLGA